MHVPPSFREQRTDVLHALVRAHPLATLVTTNEDGVDAHHLPLLLTNAGEFGTLQGHASRALNFARWSNTRVLVIFQAAAAYVSPSWYPSKERTGMAVPTWNYAVVHARGELKVIDDATWVRRHLDALTHSHEHARTTPWTLEDAPAEYTAKLVGSLVGLEIRIEQLTGKFKLSQNRQPDDRKGVIAGLTAEQTASADAVARLMDNE